MISFETDVLDLAKFRGIIIELIDRWRLRVTVRSVQRWTCSFWSGIQELKTSEQDDLWRSLSERRSQDLEEQQDWETDVGRATSRLIVVIVRHTLFF